MSENYIVINGKKSKLTEEQIKAFKKEAAEEKNPFAGREVYVYTIVEPGGVDKVLNNPSIRENGLAFKDIDFARQVALHQLLYRKLLKYAYDNDAAVDDWTDPNSKKYFIAKSIEDNKFYVYWNIIFKYNGVIYFKGFTQDDYKKLEFDPTHVFTSYPRENDYKPITVERDCSDIWKRYLESGKI